MVIYEYHGSGRSFPHLLPFKLTVRPEPIPPIAQAGTVESRSTARQPREKHRVLWSENCRFPP
jgi:hypothetical protein